MKKYLKYLFLFIMCFSLFNINASAEDLEPGLYCTDGTFVPWAESGIDNTCSNANFVIPMTYSTATKVVISDSVTSIDNIAFMDCVNLTEIIIPNSVVSLGESAFSGCTNLTNITIPDSVTSIGGYAFNGCTNLICINIPDGVVSLANNTFQGCTNLISITVNENNAIYDSRNNCNAIIETATNKLIVGCKNTIIPDGVTSIGDYAFQDCIGLTSIAIPESVIGIGNFAFSGCDNVSKFYINNKDCTVGFFAFPATSTIYCYNNSPAYTYAVDNSVTYVLLDAVVNSGNISTINGAIEATVIDITVPLNVACSIDPNTEDGFVSSDIVIVNNTKCPVSLNVSNFEKVSGSFTDDILPDGLPTNLNWNNLNAAQTQQYFALGIAAKDSSEWKEYNLTNPLYVANIATDGETTMGVINYNGTINLVLNAFYGKAFKEAATISYQIVFIAELY